MFVHENIVKTLQEYLSLGGAIDDSFIFHILGGGTIQSQEECIWYDGVKPGKALRKKPTKIEPIKAEPNVYYYLDGVLYEDLNPETNCYHPVKGGHPLTHLDLYKARKLIDAEPISIDAIRIFCSLYLDRYLLYQGYWFKKVVVTAGKQIVLGKETVVTPEQFMSCMTDEGVKVSSYFTGVTL